MASQKNQDREFARYLDRLLGGEEVEAAEVLSEEVRSALSFARKISELRAEPPPQFREQLKARLLQQLAQQGAEGRQGSFWEFLRGLVPQSPLWRTVAATLVVALVAVSLIWRMGLLPPTQIQVGLEADEEAMLAEEQPEAGVTGLEAVSYTHLTLPTKA